jgi:alpha-beta hydrolase superfamily lysophospholipase
MIQHTLTVPVPAAIAGQPGIAVAAELFVPARPQPLLLVCTPGGGMNRRYFDIAVGDDRSYSFARAMAAAGLMVATLDTPGIGDSPRPADGFSLTPDMLAAANAHAARVLAEGVRTGGLVPGLAGVPDTTVLGVGHSMGAALTLMMQAAHGPFTGLILLGFSCNGLRQILTEEEAGYEGRPDALRAALRGLAMARYQEDYPPVGGSERMREQGRDLFSAARVPRALMEALAPARAPLLPQPATFVLVPGSLAPEAARITVPVLLALGDSDIAGPPHAIPASFPACPDLGLLVLPQTGHTHFVFASRETLFRRCAGWAAAQRPA